jgi:hypothetical protein
MTKKRGSTSATGIVATVLIGANKLPSAPLTAVSQITKRRMGIAALLAAGATLLAIAASTPARADTVTDWNMNATSALMGTLGQPPQVSVPHLAMVHGAVYDAVNAIDGGREGYLISSRLATPSDSKEAAAATAAYRVLALVEDARNRRRRRCRHGDDRGTDE